VLRKILHFNPTCEMAVANGSPYYVAPALLRAFEEDLAPIMMHFAEEKDIVVCSEHPDAEWLELMRSVGFTIPSFKTMVETEQLVSERGNYFLELKAWGNSPVVDNNFKFIKNLSIRYEGNYTTLFERKYSRDILQKLVANTESKRLFDPSIVPILLTFEREVEAFLSKCCPAVFKAPLSSSGRGLLVLRKSKLNEANRQWLKGVLEQQGYITAGPWLNKQLDFSFQFETEEDNTVNYLGCSYFTTNSNGQYSGHYLNYRVKEQLPIADYLFTEIAALLKSVLTTSDYATKYCGPFGVDGLIYLDSQGNYRIHPCLEINPRHTMGALSLKIESRIPPEATGFYKTFYDSKSTFGDFCELQRKKNPPTIVEGRLRKGFLNLTPSSGHHKFGAYIELF